MALLLLWLFILASAILLLYYLLRPGNLDGNIPEPPGKLPVVGHAFALGTDPKKTFLKWKRDIGPVFQISIFGRKIVLLNTRESISEWFARQETSGRLLLKLAELFAKLFGHGIITNEGPHVEEIRVTLIKALREHGNKAKLNVYLQEEVKRFLDKWQAEAGTYFNLYECYGEVIMNGAWRVIGSKPLNHETAKRVINAVQVLGDLSSGMAKLSFVAPALAEWFSTAVTDKKNAMQHTLVAIAAKEIEWHKKDRIPNMPRDVIDSLIDKEESSPDFSSAFHASQKTLVPVLRDVILATVDTVSATMEFFTILGVLYPDKIEKLVKEIHTVVGTQRPPSLDDKENMPYTQACMIETFRVSAVSTFGLPHSVIEDVNISGYRVEKGTIVLSNLYCVHHDPQVWEDAEDFRPERFLTPEGKLKSEAWKRVMPFSAGKRSCVGNKLAMDEFFMIVTGVHQRFSIRVRDMTVLKDALNPPLNIVSRPRKGVQICVIPHQKM